MDILQLVSSGGDTDLIRCRIASADSDALNSVSKKKGNTPLHVAAIKNRADIAALLLDAGAAIDTKNRAGETPLLVATRERHKDCVQLLLQAGADWHASDQLGNTPMHQAARWGDQITLSLLAKYADVNIVNSSGQTPLHVATEFGHADCFFELLKHKANIRLEDRSGNTPLHLAAKEGHTEIVTALLEAGADPNGDLGYTPLYYAALNMHAECFALLLNAGAKVHSDMKHWYAGSGNLDALLLVMKVDKNTHEPDKDGRTILHLLARARGLDGDLRKLEEALCDAGMDLNMADNEGNTALHYVSESDRKADLVSALIRLGADVNARDSHAITPLHTATLEGHTGLVQLLLDNGADANVLDRNGNSLLHIAASREHPDCIRILLPLTSKGNINGHNNQGLTPLLIAAMKGDDDSVTLLLNTGADPNKLSCPETSHETLVNPLNVAISEYDVETSAALIQYGALPTGPAFDALISIYKDFQADTTDQVERFLLPRRRQLLELMLQGGMDPTLVMPEPESECGDTLLHVLCSNGAPIEDILELLEHDSSTINTKNADGDTPLASYISWAETLRIGAMRALLEYGADASIKDGKGLPLLSLLDRRPDVEPAGLRQLLIDNGADDPAQSRSPQPEQAPPAPETLPGAAPAPLM